MEVSNYQWCMRNGLCYDHNNKQAFLNYRCLSNVGMIYHENGIIPSVRQIPRAGNDTDR